MTQRLATLATLLARQKQERDAAAGTLASAREGAGAARRQADELAGYRDAFHARWGAQPGQRVDVGVLRAYQGFGQRLEHAIGVQQSVVRGHEARVDQARAQLLRQDTRVATTERLIGRAEAALAQGAARQEQKQADEAAAQRLLRRRQEPRR